MTRNNHTPRRPSRMSDYFSFLFRENEFSRLSTSRVNSESTPLRLGRNRYPAICEGGFKFNSNDRDSSLIGTRVSPVARR